MPINKRFCYDSGIFNDKNRNTSSKSLSQLHLPVNITIYGVFEDVKYLCFFIITSQVSNHYYVFVS